MAGVARDFGRETPTRARASQTLANRWDNSPRLSASAKQNPRSRCFATPGFKLRGPNSVRAVESIATVIGRTLPAIPTQRNVAHRFSSRDFDHTHELPGTPHPAAHDMILTKLSKIDSRTHILVRSASQPIVSGQRSDFPHLVLKLVATLLQFVMAFLDSLCLLTSVLGVLP